MKLEGKQPMIFGDQSARFSFKMDPRDDLHDVMSKVSCKSTNRGGFNQKKKSSNYQQDVVRELEFYRSPNEH